MPTTRHLSSSVGVAVGSWQRPPLSLQEKLAFSSESKVLVTAVDLRFARFQPYPIENLKAVDLREGNYSRLDSQGPLSSLGYGYDLELM